MKIENPKLGKNEQKDFYKCLEEDNFASANIENTEIKQEVIIEDITIDSCTFKNIDFTKVIFRNVDLIDVCFENCNLSNKDFDERLINRVIFKNTKLTGSSMIDTSLKDVQIIDCNATYLNLAEIGRAHV